jgi:peptidoglycan/xylan/chitin deacetylase (PgdA/CDA1 family)/glycosyltransferase involved in cell wall biosynthesis
MIRISVIIPTYNRRHVLERTLPGVLAQDFPPQDYEVIVVMDGSTDGTAEMLRDLKPNCSLRVLESQHLGAGAARNVGIRAAVGELVLFLDDDLITTPGLLRQHYSAHAGADPRVVQGRMYIAPDSSQTIIRDAIERIGDAYYVRISPDMDLRFPEGMSSVYVLSYLVNSSMPRDVLVRCGGFDDQFLAAEELDLGLCLWKMGLSFRYRPDAIVYEYYLKSSAAYLQSQARALGAGDLRASRKHYEYRPHCGLSTWAESHAGKRWLLKPLTSLPISLIPLMSLPLRMEKSFYRFETIRKLATRLLNWTSTVAHLEGALGVASSWKALEDEFERSCSSLLYHHVGPARPGTKRELTVSPERFERQIRWLARRGYAGIKPSDWLNWIRHGTSLPKKPILVTFDDAYADTADYGLPILRKYGFSAAVFVVTERLAATNTWDEVQGCGTLQLMTAEQIRYWAREGIEFGAHSRTHPHLAKLSASELAAEVIGGKDDLTALLGYPPVSFAYPYGEYNDAVCELVRGNFDMAFSVEEGLNYLSGDPHLLRRAYVGAGDSLIEFALSVRRGGIRRLRDWRIKLALRTRLKRALRIGSPHP